MRIEYLNSTPEIRMPFIFNETQRRFFTDDCIRFIIGGFWKVKHSHEITRKFNEGIKNFEIQDRLFLTYFTAKYTIKISESYFDENLLYANMIYIEGENINTDFFQINSNSSSRNNPSPKGTSINLNKTLFKT